MKQELSDRQPEEIMVEIEQMDKLANQTVDAMDAMLKQIQKTETDCLKSIFTRFCLKNAKIVDFSLVKPRTLPGRPNHTAYYYKIGTKDEYFLMERELVNDNGSIKLNINFNKELTFNNEL